MAIRIQKLDLFIDRTNGNVSLCSSNGQKMIITDKNIIKKPDSEIIKHYQALNIFSQNGRC